MPLHYPVLALPSGSAARLRRKPPQLPSSHPPLQSVSCCTRPLVWALDHHSQALMSRVRVTCVCVGGWVCGWVVCSHTSLHTRKCVVLARVCTRSTRNPGPLASLLPAGKSARGGSRLLLVRRKVVRRWAAAFKKVQPQMLPTIKAHDACFPHDDWRRHSAAVSAACIPRRLAGTDRSSHLASAPIARLHRRTRQQHATGGAAPHRARRSRGP